MYMCVHCMHVHVCTVHVAVYVDIFTLGSSLFSIEEEEQVFTCSMLAESGGNYCFKAAITTH